jgi:hypothetical protein
LPWISTPSTGEEKERKGKEGREGEKKEGENEVYNVYHKRILTTWPKLSTPCGSCLLIS